MEKTNEHLVQAEATDPQSKPTMDPEAGAVASASHLLQNYAPGGLTYTLDVIIGTLADKLATEDIRGSHYINMMLPSMQLVARMLSLAKFDVEVISNRIELLSVELLTLAHRHASKESDLRLIQHINSVMYEYSGAKSTEPPLCIGSDTDSDYIQFLTGAAEYAKSQGIAPADMAGYLFGDFERADVFDVLDEILNYIEHKEQNADQPGDLSLAMIHHLLTKLSPNSKKQLFHALGNELNQDYEVPMEDAELSSEPPSARGIIASEPAEATDLDNYRVYPAVGGSWLKGVSTCICQNNTTVLKDMHSVPEPVRAALIALTDALHRDRPLYAKEIAHDYLSALIALGLMGYFDIPAGFLNSGTPFRVPLQSISVSHDAVDFQPEDILSFVCHTMRTRMSNWPSTLIREWIDNLGSAVWDVPNSWIKAKTIDVTPNFQTSQNL